jgi:cyanophycin synthetase
VERDAALDATLAKAELSMESVLPKGERLTLRSIANFSTGGSATEMTAEVHPQIRGLAELLAAAVGLRTAGIDYVTTDITRSHGEVGGGFIEVNAMPRLRVLMNDVHPEEEIGALMLGERPGRIPVTLVVGDSEALVEFAGPVRMQLESRPRTGAVSPEWAQVGATMLPAAGLDAFGLVEALLRNKAVEDVLILWSPAELTNFGVPADLLARAIVIGDADGPACLPEICGDIVRVADAQAALAVAFPG